MRRAERPRGRRCDQDGQGKVGIGGERAEERGEFGEREKSTQGQGPERGRTHPRRDSCHTVGVGEEAERREGEAQID